MAIFWSGVWFVVSMLAGGLVLLVIRRFFGTRRTMKRVALSLAVCERALEDALAELSLSEAAFAGDAGQVFVSPFEPVVQRLSRIPAAELCALGKPAAELGRRLAICVETWDAAAGRTQQRAALLPLMLEAHHLARELVRFVEEDSLLSARLEVKARVLVALVAPPDPREVWLQ